jgi:two-component system chemotaxis response regulator CheB
LVIDDSALVRAAVKEILDRTPDLRVVATAADPLFARDKLQKLEVDVITLDVEMPRMDGITFLEKLMAHRPTPVVMLSSTTATAAKNTLRALSLGAVDFVTKPNGAMGGIETIAEELVTKLRAAARVKPRRVAERKPLAADAPPSQAAGTLRAKRAQRPSVLEAGPVEAAIRVDAVLEKRVSRARSGGEPLIVIGASTGGTGAIEEVLSGLNGSEPGIVIVQHMPPGFTRAFAERLDQITALEVVEAEQGVDVRAGRVIVAQGGVHLVIQRAASAYRVELRHGPLVNRHRPSVDVLFRSAANSAGDACLGILLTGMGDDGARGLKDLRDVGADTLAQDEESCVVFGMPKVAIDLGAARRVLPLHGVAGAIRHFSGN